MKRFAFAAALLAFAAPLHGQDQDDPPWNGERLILPDMAGFALVYEQSDILSEARYVPEGESEEEFSRMITVETVSPRVHQGRSAADALRERQQWIAEDCAGETQSEVREFDLHGRTAAEMHFDCPRTKERPHPQSAFFRSIDGASNIHVVIVGFPHAPDAAEVRWAEEFLDAVRLCPANSLGECP